MTPTMPEAPSNGVALLLLPKSQEAETLQEALKALKIAFEVCEQASELPARVDGKPPALLVVDMRALPEPEALIELIDQVCAASAVRPARLLALAPQDDLRHRLAAMRSGADVFHLAVDEPDLLATHIGLLLGAQRQDPVRVMVVDDQPVAALFASRVLQGAGMLTRRVTDPMTVMDVLDSFQPDLVLMDLHMPGASGIELTGVIRSQDRFADLPIIFLSAELDPTLQMAALQIGGDDFLSKPVAPDRLTRIVEGRLRRARELKGHWEGPRGVDPLTRLATRERLLKRLDWLLGQSYSAQLAANRHGVSPSRTGQRALIYLDIMGLEESLELAAAEVSTLIGREDLAARVGERAIGVLVYRGSHQEIAELAQLLLYRVGRLLDERSIGADAGGGWYPLTGACNDSVTLVSRAAKAARWSLRGSSKQPASYEGARAQDDDAARRLGVLEAIRYERMELLYEPMVALTGMVGERYEMTPRLVVGDGEVLAPGDFMPIVAGAGLAPRFDRWLLASGLDVLKSKMDANQPVLLFIHQSLYGLAKEDWIYWVREQINQRDLIRLRPVLQFEIGEADRQLELAIKRSRQLNRLGIRVCLNGLDFSERSMRVLHSVPSGYVRISRRVIHGPDADSIAWLIQSIKACGARVIATGVDGPAAIARLFGAGVDLIQGPYVQPPSFAMDFEFTAGEGSSL